MEAEEFTKATNNDIRSETICNSPMRVVLMQQTGNMYEIWLPPVVEGRYLFEQDNSHHLPIAIKAEQGKWYAICSEDARILTQNNSYLKKTEIFDQALYEIDQGGNKYIVYTEAEQTESNPFVPYYIEKREAITIGRLPNCDIYYDNMRVSRNHAVLSWRNDRWYISDSGSTNGTYLNGKSIEISEFHAGDSVYIMGMRLYMGVGYVSINVGNGHIKITSPALRQVTNSEEIVFAPCVRHQETALFNRFPRRRAFLQPEPIDIDSPPQSLSNKMPLLLRLGSPLVSGGRSIIMGNAFGAVASLLVPLATQGYNEKDRRDYETNRKKLYREYLQKKEQEIRNEINAEEAFLGESYPDVHDVLDFVNQRNRLWERQKNHCDFLQIRVGYGNKKMMAEKRFEKQRFSLDHDELEEEMFQLANKPELLQNVPLTISLKDDPVVGILGAAEQSSLLLQNMILQLAMTHSYDEVKMVLLDDGHRGEILDFAGYLPHFWNEDRSVRYLARTPEDAQQLSKQLIKLYEEYTETNQRRIVLKEKPAIVIFACSKELFDAVEVLKDIIHQDEYCGFSVVACFDNLPKECTKLLDLKQGQTIVDLSHPENENVDFILDVCEEEYAYSRIHRVMDTKIRISEQQFELPKMLTFLDMYRVGKVEHLNPMKRWEENNPVKSIAAPIGVGTDGKVFTLDLHEKKQGPHGLVAGMTGSGKSEFIITYVLSMAVNYSPDEVAFVLIDYKGGGLADAFVDASRGIHLPHVVGTITNLDGAGIQRSLLSINSELKRRQAVFSATKSKLNEGTMDIYDYQKFYRQKRVTEPMPHLFIICDEFAELKKQEPEFMNELISTARIGRSLGVHLILATQKPSGVVNDQIWSNSKFRVCLRVQDKGDSMEMLKRPEAAELKHTGRFYLQVGYNELFALGQSAWCGADYVPNEECVTEVDNTVQFVDATGQTILNAKPAQKKVPAEHKQIVSIVQYLSNLANRENIMPRILWKEPLPERLELAELLRQWVQPEEGVWSLVGMTDDPERQRQDLFAIDMQGLHNMLVIGTGGSGKSRLLRTLLYSLSARYSPRQVNYYIADLSGTALSAFRHMPHCGAYIDGKSEKDFVRLMQFLREVAEERKELFAKADVTNYDAYLQVAPMPLILFVIDNYQNLLSLFASGSEIYANFHTFMSEVSGYGIRVIAACNHSNEISSKCKQELDYRITLQTKDKYDCSEALGIRVKNMPPNLPGRGVCAVEDRALEYHVASLHCDMRESDSVQLLRNDLKKLAEQYSDCPPARSLPMPKEAQTYADFSADTEMGGFPLGYTTKNMHPVFLPFSQMPCLSLYFGNPDGVRPVLHNLLTVAERNHMETMIVKRNEDSQFDSQNNLLEEFGLKSSLLYCDSAGLDVLAQRLNEEVRDRNALVDAYSDQVGIPHEEHGRAKKAEKYVRDRTTPILVLFESFADFAKLRKSEMSEAVFNAFIGGLKGYNIYFVGCFYPNDQQKLRADILLPRFNQAELFVMFGGSYSTMCLSANIPQEYRKVSKPQERYDMGVLHYRGEWHDLQMPCGKLKKSEVAADEASIV